MSGNTRENFVKEWQHQSGREIAENRKDSDKMKMKLQ